MIPASHAVRAALVLKLLGTARRSHVMDLLFDDGVALAVGLNAVPKATFMSQYSSPLGRRAIVRLLGAWIERLPSRSGATSAFGRASSFAASWIQRPASPSPTPRSACACRGALTIPFCWMPG